MAAKYLLFIPLATSKGIGTAESIGHYRSNNYIDPIYREFSFYNKKSQCTNNNYYKKIPSLEFIKDLLTEPREPFTQSVTPRNAA